jgi:stearoyl-CoA desaturase (delta-9 desaturase)
VQTVLERPDAEPIRGTLRLSAAELRLQRRVTLLFTAGPLAGVALAMALLWRHGISALSLALFASFYVFTGLGITVGFHRLFTHRSFRAVAPVRWVLAVAGSMAVEGSVISWVSTHRRHHAYADRYGDPHSPHLATAPGVRGVLSGLWHAHMGWFFDQTRSNVDEWSPDLRSERAMRRIDRAFP